MGSSGEGEEVREEKKFSESPSAQGGLCAWQHGTVEFFFLSASICSIFSRRQVAISIHLHPLFEELEGVIRGRGKAGGNEDEKRGQ